MPDRGELHRQCRHCRAAGAGPQEALPCTTASRSTAIVRELRAAGIAGATTLRGIWGFHGDHSPHGDRLLQLGRYVPAVSVVVDAPERIATAFAVIDELTREQGLVTSETVPALRAGGRGGRLAGKVPPE